MFSLLAAIAACSGEQGGDGAGNTADLRLRLKQGERLRVWSLTEQEIRQSMLGELGITQRIGLATTYDVLGVDSAGVATLRVVYDSLAFMQDGAIGHVEYSSADTSAQAPPLASGFAAMIGLGFTIRMGTDGRVLEIMGADSLREQIVRRLAEQRSSAGMPSMNMGQGVSPESLKESIEQGLAMYPGRPIRPGDTWTRSTATLQGFPLKGETEYTLKSVDGDIATIGVEGKMEQDPDADMIGAKGFTYELAGTQEGTMKIDMKNGWVIESEIQQELSGTFSVKGSTGGGKYPVSVEGKSSTKLLEK